jgi:hypothetical protein
MHFLGLPRFLISTGDSLMTLVEFVKTLQSMLKNPNAIDINGDVIYLYTSDGELISFSVA